MKTRSIATFTYNFLQWFSRKPLFNNLTGFLEKLLEVFFFWAQQSWENKKNWGYSEKHMQLTYSGWTFFGAAHGSGGEGGGAKRPPFLKSVAHILQWWNLAQLYLTQRRSKKYMNHVTHPLSSADISIFSPEINKFCYIKKYRYRLYFDT